MSTLSNSTFEQRVCHFLGELRNMLADAPLDIRESLTEDSLLEVARVLAGGEVFDVVAELFEAQRLEEHALHKQLMDLRAEQSAERIQLRRKHAAERLSNRDTKHPLELQRDQEREIQVLRKQQQDAVRSLAKHIVHVLDGRVVEQQSALERLACYVFTPTTNPRQIRVQMQILDWIMRLSNRGGKAAAAVLRVE